MQAIALKPDFAEAYSNLGNALKDKGHLDEAIAACAQAISLKPAFAEAHNNLGNALKDKRQLSEAIAAFRRAIDLKPSLAEAHNNLGNALQGKGHWNQAIAAFRQAIKLKPEFAEAHNNFGNAMESKGKLDEAIAAYMQAIALRPDFAEAHSNFGNAMKDKGHLNEAIAAYRRAIALEPDLAQVHNNFGLALLLQADFAQGWEEYEWRWKLKDTVSLRQDIAKPEWDGGHLAGRTILLHAEQGFGDTLQFIRYVPLVQQRGGEAIVVCQPELRRLLQTMTPGLPVVARGQPLPAFDVHCPLLSVPRLFGTDLTNIPDTVPYLHAGAEDIGFWRARLADYSGYLKVGLVWAGSPRHKKDSNRSLKFSSFALLAKVSGVRFFSLQKGEAATEFATPPQGMELVDMSGELEDFADTAAFIANLDLIVTVDTSVAHLAGAMGRPVWTLLPFAPDWRWLLEREDSPWYPTMRLFRQPAVGDWDSVIQRVAKELAVFRV